MAFQSTVSNQIGFGVVGEEYLDGPRRAQPGVLNTVTPANNVIGRAFTIVDDATASFDTAADPAPLEVAAGGTGIFAGILVNPKVYASGGTSAGGPLAPTTTLANGTVVELLQETAGVIIAVPDAVAIGDWVWFLNTDGSLLTSEPEPETPPAGATRVPNGRITRFESAAAGLAVMQFDDLA